MLLLLGPLDAVVQSQEAPRLTSLNAFICNSAGRFDEMNYWNVISGDDAADLFLVIGEPNGQILNGTVRGVDYLLSEGEHLFSVLCDDGAEKTAYGLNLYFNDSTVPRISVFARPRTSLAGPILEFHPDDMTVYNSGNFGQAAFTTQGAGTLTTEVDGSRVELTDFWWARKDVFAVDRVGKYSVGADGSKEHVGQFKVRVSPLTPPVRFIRGDVDGSGKLNIADPVLLLNYLFLGAAADCAEAGDADDDGQLEIRDAIGLLGYLFLDTLPPRPPFPGCGEDLDGDSLVCLTTAGCP